MSAAVDQRPVYEAVERGPVDTALVELIKQILPAGLGALPVDPTTGEALELPVVVVDPGTGVFTGPPMGDRLGSARWSYTLRVLGRRHDQAVFSAGRVLGHVTARDGITGAFLHPLVVSGQHVVDVDPADGSYEAAPSANGIVAVLLRLSVHTQRLPGARA